MVQDGVRLLFGGSGIGMGSKKSSIKSSKNSSIKSSIKNEFTTIEIEQSSNKNDIINNNRFFRENINIYCNNKLNNLQQKNRNNNNSTILINIFKKKFNFFLKKYCQKKNSRKNNSRILILNINRILLNKILEDEEDEEGKEKIYNYIKNYIIEKGEKNYNIINIKYQLFNQLILYLLWNDLEKVVVEQSNLEQSNLEQSNSEQSNLVSFYESNNSNNHDDIYNSKKQNFLNPASIETLPLRIRASRAQAASAQLVRIQFAKVQPT